MKITIFILSILLLILPNTSSHASKERTASPAVKQHAEAARQLGATNAQIKQAFGIAGYMRMLNATLHRLDIDPKQPKFQGENQ